jgi:hypothetical protein
MKTPAAQPAVLLRPTHVGRPGHVRVAWEMPFAGFSARGEAESRYASLSCVLGGGPSNSEALFSSIAILHSLCSRAFYTRP